MWWTRRSGIDESAVPTILREGPYRFYFVSGDGGEPPHVHVRRDRGFAKFWLNPVTLQNGVNLGNAEIRRIQRIVDENQEAFLEAWHGYFND